MGLIDFPPLATYEQYRKAPDDAPDHKKNFVRLKWNGANVAVNRSII